MVRETFVYRYAQRVKTAIYARVSKNDGEQTPDNQLAALRAHCEQHDLEIIEEYVDLESGRKGRADRAAFDQLMRDATKGRFQLVLFWSLDRFSRQGIRQTITYLQQLDASGVKFKSLQEPFLDSGDELVSHILLGVLAYFGELEAKRISERTKAGLERARKSGKTLGRPTIDTRTQEEIRRLTDQGVSIKKAAKQLGLSPSTVSKYRQASTRTSNDAT